MAITASDRREPIVVLFSMRKREQIAAIPGGRAPVAFSASGNAVAIQSDDHITLWNPQTGSPNKSLPPQPGVVISVALSSDASIAVEVRDVGTRQHAVHVWNVLKAMPVTLDDKSIEAQSTGTVSPDGSLVAVGYRDGAITLYRASSGEAVATQRRMPSAIGKLTFSADGKTLLAVREMAPSEPSDRERVDPRVSVWTVDSGLTLRAMLSEPQDDAILSALPTTEMFSDPLDVALDENGPIRALAGEGATLSAWNANSGRLENALELPHPAGGFWSLTPDLTTMAIECLEGSDGVRHVEFVDLSGFLDVLNTPRASLQHPAEVFAAKFASDGAHILTAGGGIDTRFNDSTTRTSGVALWDASRSGTVDRPIRHQKGRMPFQLLAVGSASSLVAATSRVGGGSEDYASSQLLLWDPSADASNAIDCPDEVCALALSEDGSRLVVGLTGYFASEELRGQGSLKLFDSGARRWRDIGGLLPHRPKSISLSHAGDKAAVAFGYEETRQILIRDLESGKDVSVPTDGPCRGAVFLPGDDRIASLEPRKIVVRQSSDGQDVLTVDTGDRATCFCASPDGRLAAVGYRIQPESDHNGKRRVALEASIHDLLTGRRLKTLRWAPADGAGKGEVRDVDFSQDGESLAAVGSDLRVAIWDWRSAKPQGPRQLAESVTQGTVEEPARENGTLSVPLPTDVRGRSLSEWIHISRTGSPTDRQSACEALGVFAKAQSADAADALVALLDTPRPGSNGVPWLAWYAMDAISGAGPGAKSAVPALVKRIKLQLGKYPLQIEALEALGAIGPAAEEAVPAIWDIILDDTGRYSYIGPDYSFSRGQRVHPLEVAADKALWEIGLPSISEGVTRWNGLMSANDRLAVDRQFRALGAFQGLAKRYPDNMAEVTNKLAQLIETKPRATTRYVSSSYTSDSFEMRLFGVISAIGDRCGEDPRLPAVVAETMIRTNDWHLRSTCYRAIEAMGPGAEGAVPTLKRALKDNDPKVSKMALDLLKRIDPDAALEAPTLSPE